jgi:glucose-1-phosphate thymidylyltransferase
VRSEVVSGWWKDTGQLADMLEANRLVLEDIVTKLDGEVEDSRVEGRVIVEEGAVLRNSLVRGPAVIGKGAVVDGAYIGPYTSIGDEVRVINSEIEHSIVLSGSSVENLGARIEASLLGRDVKLTRSDSLPRTMRLLVGDRSEIEIV